MCCQCCMSKDSIRILQYNIQSGTSTDGMYSLEKTAGVINSVKPDLVAVQEIEIRCQKNCYDGSVAEKRRNADQPTELAALTNMRCVFESKTLQFGGEYGTAALTRLPLLAHKALHFKSWDTHHGSNLWYGKLPQVAVALKVHPQGWKKPIWFVSTHLGCDASGKEQDAELKEIFHFVGEQTQSEKAHIVIAGDFNLPSFYKAIKNLPKHGYQDCWSTATTRIPCPSALIPGATHPSNRPVVRLDYVIATRGLSVSEARVLDTTASDHLPLFVQLEEREGDGLLHLEPGQSRYAIKKEVTQGSNVINLKWQQNLLKRKADYRLYLCEEAGSSSGDTIPLFIQEGLELNYSDFAIDDGRFQFGCCGNFFLVLHKLKNKPYQDRFKQFLIEYKVFRGEEQSSFFGAIKNLEMTKSLVGEYLWDYSSVL
eukprot:TRINITY_DN5484_c0_g1_i1.p1 TRINITY_DN5484_c0_g1~~TRINITY_DN5484_c0_g1_i1.p1  ORF type:complete len:426 (-),score=82.00 TRINITY_DN5484_c0_g1_i1:143-1420(-)